MLHVCLWVSHAFVTVGCTSVYGSNMHLLQWVARLFMGKTCICYNGLHVCLWVKHAFVTVGSTSVYGSNIHLLQWVARLFMGQTCICYSGLHVCLWVKHAFVTVGCTDNRDCLYSVYMIQTQTTI